MDKNAKYCKTILDFHEVVSNRGETLRKTTRVAMKPFATGAQLREPSKRERFGVTRRELDYGRRRKVETRRRTDARIIDQ